MSKEEIAKHLSINSINPLSTILKNYLHDLKDLDDGYIFDDSKMRLHYCISYLSDNNFDATDWCLFEIPHAVIHAFYNDTTQESFDIAVYDKKEVYPEYLDCDFNMRKATSVQAAISSYCQLGVGI